MVSVARIFQQGITGILMAICFWQCGGDYSLSGIQSQSGINFMLCLAHFFTWTMQGVLTFQLEREVFLREQASGMYSPSAYFLAKNIVELPGLIISPTIFLLVIYWAIGMTNFAQVWLIFLLVPQIGFGLAITISACCSNTQTATAVTFPSMMP